MALPASIQQQDIDTGFIENWARRYYKITDPDKLAELAAIYRAWYAKRDHHTAVDGNGDREQANVVLKIYMHDTPKGERWLVAAENKTIGKLRMREQILYNEAFRQMDDMRLGNQVMVDGEWDTYAYKWDVDSQTLRNLVWRVQSDGRESLMTALFAVINPALKPDNYVYKPREEMPAGIRVLSDHVDATEKQRVRGAIATFLSHLDQGALAIMRKTRFFDRDLPTLDGYGWLTGCREGFGGGGLEKIPDAAPASAIRNRQDMARIYPGLLYFMVSNDWGDGDFTRAVDAGEPRVAVLAKHLGQKGCHDRGADPLPQEFIRWLRGKNRGDFDGWEYEANRFIRDIANPMVVAAALPREDRPRTHQEWRKYQDAYYTFSELSSVFNLSIPRLVQDFARACRNETAFPTRILVQGADMQENIIANAPRLRFGRERGEINNFADFVKDSARQIVVPAIVQRANLLGKTLPMQREGQGNGYDLAQWTDCNPTHKGLLAGRLASCVYENITLERLLHMADRWHQRAHRLVTRTHMLEGTYRWPELIEAVTAPNGASLMSMASTADLTYMGDLMKNCVGGYTHLCVLGDSHIVALESPDGTERALLELREVAEAGPPKVMKVTIQQLETDNNQKAPVWAQEVANWLVAEINSKRIAVDWPAIQAYRQLKRSEFQNTQLELVVGFDPSRKDLAERAYEAWHHEMRTLYPQETLAEYLETSGINALLDKEFGPVPEKRGGFDWNSLLPG